MSREHKVAIVSGAGAQSANELMIQLVKGDWLVVGLSGGEKTSNNPNITYVRIDRDQLHDGDYVAQAAREGMKRFGVKAPREMAAVNLIGGAHPTHGLTLEEMNFSLPVTFFRAVDGVGREAASQTSAVNISSMVAALPSVQCETAQLKRKLNDWLESSEEGPSHHRISMLPGLILAELEEGRRVNMRIDYSSDQFRNLPLIPLMGSGDQPHQAIGEAELYEGTTNALNREEALNSKVLAVGREVLTQKELMTHFNDRAHFFAHIPTEMALELSQHFPFGRFNPYVVRSAQTLDENPQEGLFDFQEFEELLGRPAPGMREKYQRDRVIVEERDLPLSKHMGCALESLRNNPSLMFPCSAAIARGLLGIRFSIIDRNTTD